MRFRLSNGREVIKLGFSRDPRSRLIYQLVTSPDQDAALLRSIPVPSGRMAIGIEKGLHAHIKQLHPEAVLPLEEFGAEIRVRSEVYDARILDVVMGLLDEVETKLKALARRSAKPVRRPRKDTTGTLKQRRTIRRSRRKRRNARR